jgi:hypothetical protein
MDSRFTEGVGMCSRRHGEGGTRLVSFLVLLLLISQWCWPQQVSQNVSIQVQVDQSGGPIRPVWNYFGYDEPNYTCAPNGKKLLGEFAALDAAPVYVRVYNLLTTGDGTASLKWGSTKVYSEDASGHPIYSWVILDQIFDTFRADGIKLMVEIGFMPGSGLMAGTGDGDVAEAGVEQVRVDAGIGVIEDAFDGEALGSVTGDGIAVVEMTVLAGAELDLLVVVEVGGEATIGMNRLDGREGAIGNAERFVGRVNWMRSPTENPRSISRLL